ncbi:UNVERIFIED_CONTAM: hypothetical protein GTU68_001708, partial [Idotea baltica]|nr:hypothetical protein [Idotea baltica]
FEKKSSNQHFTGTLTTPVSSLQYINEQPKIPLHGGQKIPSHSLMGNVEFKDVAFTYPTRPLQEVLTNFNLRVPAGKVVAIVGASGGGKSTLAQLLERFYDVTKGQITIDG